MRALLPIPVAAMLACGPAAPSPQRQPSRAPAAATPPSRSPLTPEELGRLAELLNPMEDPPPDAAAEVDPASAWSTAPPGATKTAVAFSAKDRADVQAVLCEGKPMIATKRGPRCDCPSYADSPGPVSTEFGVGIEFEGFVPGHFSGPGRQEVVVFLGGHCTTGAGSSQTYREAAMARKSAAGWTRVYYQPDALGDCTPLVAPNGRSRLFCLRTGGHQGMYPVDFQLDAFDESGGEVQKQARTVLGFTTHQGGPCCAPDPVYKLEVKRRTLLGLRAYNAGREAALAFEVTVRSTVVCLDQPARCMGPDMNPVDLSLRYTFDGAAFQLDSASAPALAKLTSRDRVASR